MINRRGFIQASLGGACGLLALSQIGLANGKKLQKVGLQLYTIRNEMQKDFEGSLARVAEIGYKEVEFAGYYNHTPEQVREILAKNKLTSPSSHSGIAEIRKDWQKTIDFSKAIGNQYLVCAYLAAEERKTLDQFKQLAETFNKAGEQCRKAGLQFCYHNHDFEFQPVEGQLLYDYLLKNTSPELVKMEMDLFWVVKANQDPVAYFNRFPGRFPLVHVKDMDKTPKKFFAEVGRGSMDFKRIFAASKKAGIKHYIVEQDQTPGNPFDSIKISYDYLKDFEF